MSASAGPRVDHLGLAVRSLDEATAQWERALGVKASEAEVVASQQVRVRFLPAGESHLELLEPTAPTSTIARFLDKRGEGLHHIAFHVPDLPAKLAELRSNGFRLIDEVPRRGARGRLVAFAHPAGLAGVLSEFVSEGPGGRP